VVEPMRASDAFVIVEHAGTVSVLPTISHVSRNIQGSRCGLLENPQEPGVDGDRAPPRLRSVACAGQQAIENVACSPGAAALDVGFVKMIGYVLIRAVRRSPIEMHARRPYQEMNEMKWCKGMSALLVLSLMTTLSVEAHHSRASFVLDDTIRINGTVTEVSWRNPHVYLVVRSTGPDGQTEEWTLESHSVSGLERNGWSKDAITVGDEVRVQANPNRDPAVKFGLLESIERDDGAVFYSFRAATVPQSGDTGTEVVAPSVDFSGTWTNVSELPPDQALRKALVGNFLPPSDWPLTESGRRLVEKYDINNDPYLDCIPLGLPRLVEWPYPRSWTRTENEIRIAQDTTGQVRVIHLGGPMEPPASHEPNELGYSVGHIEPDGALVVESRGFRPMVWGLARGIDSSDQLVFVERYELVDGGLGMKLSYTIQDPVFLREPITVTRTLRKVADYVFSDEVCDRETARRHLQFEHE
jgi:hypothetical protein